MSKVTSRNTYTFSLSFVLWAFPLVTTGQVFFFMEAEAETGAEAKVADFIPFLVSSDWMDEMGDLWQDSVMIFPSWISLFIKISIDYFKCVNHTGQRPKTHHTPLSHRDWVTILCIPHSAGYTGPCFHLPTVSTRPCADSRLTQPTAHVLAQYIVIGSS